MINEWLRNISHCYYHFQFTNKEMENYIDEVTEGDEKPDCPPSSESSSYVPIPCEMSLLNFNK